MADIVEVREATFKQEVLEERLPVLVDFGAEWCGPCKMLDPIVEQLASEWDGRVKVVKVDVDQDPDLAMRYSVMGVPTLMLFSAGEVRDRVTGFQPRERLIARFGAHLPAHE